MFVILLLDTQTLFRFRAEQSKVISLQFLALNTRREMYLAIRRYCARSLNHCYRGNVTMFSLCIVVDLHVGASNMKRVCASTGARELFRSALFSK